VAMAFERVSAATGFDEDVRPNHPDFDMDGGDTGNADAHFVFAKPGAFAADHGFIRDLDDGGEEKISARPATGLKCFRNHTRQNVRQKNRLGKSNLQTTIVKN
jgi:hypothetical protein